MPSTVYAFHVLIVLAESPLNAEILKCDPLFILLPAQ